MPILKILFLDIDGVLNSRTWLRQRTSVDRGLIDELDPRAIRLLGEFVATHNIYIVISSARNMTNNLHHYREAFFQVDDKFPCLNIIDTTSLLEEKPAEIARWLKIHNSTRFAIIDDVDFGFPPEPFVRTNFQVGIQPEHIDKLREILCEQS